MGKSGGLRSDRRSPNNARASTDDRRPCTLVLIMWAPAFEHVYTIRLRSQEVLEEVPDAPEMAREVLMAHALMRHARLHGDESRSALVILNDSVKAKLLFADDGWVPAEQSSLALTTMDGYQRS